MSNQCGRSHQRLGFFKLKYILIKTYQQQGKKLDWHANISSEHQLALKVNLYEDMKTFATIKVRRVDL